MRKSSFALLLLCLTLSVPSFAQSSPLRHAQATPPSSVSWSTLWDRALALLGLETKDGTGCLDPNGCTQPPPHYHADGGTCINPDGCKPTP
jgi:hypothetical protein